MQAIRLTLVFHPPPDHAVMSKLPPEYCLSAASLRNLCTRMAGVSVTFEHLGIMLAASAVTGDLTPAAVTAELARTENAGHRNIGRVLDAWEAADGGFWATAIVPSLKGLEWLITSKQLGACSLTHVMTTPTVATPLELSLVGVPARPGCLIRLATTSALATALYKAQTISGGIPTMNTAPLAAPASAATVAATALDELPAASRELIVAKLAHLVAAVDSAEKRATDAEARTKTEAAALTQANAALAQQKLMADVDIGLLGAQIQQLCNAMPSEMLQNFSVTASDTIEAFNSGNPAKMATSALRTIMCANAAMMGNRASTGDHASPAKRQRAEVPAFAPEVAAAAAPVPDVSLTQEQLLARALFDSFETA